MNISIIGANSYIARNFIFFLEKRHAHSDNYVLNLYDFSNEHLDGSRNYTPVSILDPESVKQINMNCDLIFIFVGKTGTVNGFDEFSTFLDVNEKSLLTVLNEYRRQNSSAKLIFPSTRLVYKGMNKVLKENSEKEFKTIYAMNKWACEKYLELYHMVFNINYCIFRICIPYGSLIQGASSYGTAEFMLKKAMNGENITLYGDGSVRRTLIHMEDLCSALIEGAINNNCINDVYNIGGEDYSLKEMATEIAKKYGVNIQYVPYPDIALKIESGSTVFDDTKLSSIIGKSSKKKFTDWISE